MKKSFLLCCLLAATACCAEVTYLKNDFSDYKATPKGENPPTGVCTALPAGFSIGEENGNKYLKVRRDKAGLRQIVIGGRYNVPAYFDAKVSMKVRVPQNYGANFALTSFNTNKYLGRVLFENKEKEILCLNEKKDFVKTGIDFPINEWFDLEVNFSDAERTYTVTVKTADGKVKTSPQFPYLHNDGIRNIIIANTIPTGKTGLDIDDLSITYADEMNIKNRFNGIENAAITVDGKDIPHKNGVFETPLRLFTPTDIRVNFAGVKHITSVIVKLKSTDRIIPVEFYGSYAASGSNETLISKGAIAAGKNLYQVTFAPNDFLTARIKLNRNAKMVVESIYFAGLPLETASEKVIAYKKNIYGDFPCAVWQDQTIANLHIFNSRKDGKNHSVKINVAKRNTTDAAFPERIVDLKPGKNVISFPIADLANGDYVVSIADNSGESDGIFRRLLRRYKKFEDTSAITEIGEINGQKLYFPDNHYLEKSVNAKFSSGQAKLIEVIPRTSNDDEYCRWMTNISIKDNKVRVDYTTLDRNWSAGSERYHCATTDIGDLENAKWETQRLDKKPDFKGQNNLIGAYGPPESIGDFSAKFSGAKEVFKMYDPAKDGPVNIKQLKVRYSGAIANNSVNWKNSSHDWGVMQAIPRAWYLFYRRGVDDTLILSKTPFLIDKPSHGEFEDENTTHDNFVGQWLSDDGKTLYFSHGRWLLPSYPYNTQPYDNMNGLRMLHIWKTQDGINWEKTAFCPPTENEDPTEQQYGASVLRMRNGNGLFLAFILRYRTSTQQMDHYLAYSWDGGTWHRIDNKIFLENGDVGTFNSGEVCIPGNTERSTMLPFVNIGKDSYLNVFQVSDYYHHQIAQIVYFVKKKEFGVPFVKKAIPSLESWPLFKKIGGWEGFVEHSKQAGVSVATAKMRQDGFFFVKADDNIAELTTKKITSKSKLFANMKIADNGFAEITLLDESNNPIPDYSKKLEAGFDEVDAEIFAKLPAQPFKVNIKMQNAELFVLNFK